MSSPYLDALKLLSRRELSAAQVRQRLVRRGYDEESVEAAIERLCGERAIDDRRTAEAIAQTQVSVHRRGRLRVRRQIEQAGISSATARDAVESVFAAVDDDTLLEAALEKRLRHSTDLTDERQRARLMRYMMTQGFEPDRVIAALKKRRAG